jgi:hypothetical protein
MGLLTFQSKIGSRSKSFSPVGETGEGFVCDLTTSTHPDGQSVRRLIETVDRRVGLSLSRGERVWGRILFCGDEKFGVKVIALIQKSPNWLRDFSL